MGEQRNTPAMQRGAQSGFGDQSINAKLHACYAAEISCAKQTE
jgi:hypothetical protein